MKKYINRTWAKITAFCLMLLFLVITVASGIGIGFLVYENAYWDNGDSLLSDYRESIVISDVYSAQDFYRNNSKENYPLDTFQSLQDHFAQCFGMETCASALVITDAKSGKVLLHNYDALADAPFTKSVTFAHRQYPDLDRDITVTGQLTDMPTTNLEYNLLSTLVAWRHGIIAIGAVSLLGFLFCLIFTLTSAGHWRGREGIHLTWFDKIPCDLWLAFLCCFLPGIIDSYDISLFICSGLMIFFFFLYLPAFAAQCKAGRLFKNCLIGKIIMLLVRLCKALWRIIRKIPLVWKTALGVLLLLLFDLLCVANGYEFEFMVALMLVNVLVGLFLIYLAIGLRTLQKGGKDLAEGNYDTTVDTRHLFGDFRRHGEHLNAVQEGVQAAVAQRMKSERLKTELITNVSHDIKTPLTSIINYVDLLDKENLPEPAAQEYIEVLKRQSARLQKLTVDLVDASKAATGNIPVALEETDVDVFLTQVVGEYEQRLTQAELTPVLTVNDPFPIRSDGKLLWRVLDNLMSNACKYAMPGTRLYLTASTSDGKTVMEVKNIARYPLNISADELTERFVRGDSSRSTEGSGLGLSIAQSLTRLQGGDFDITIDGDLFKATLTFDAIVSQV